MYICIYVFVYDSYQINLSRNKIKPICTSVLAILEIHRLIAVL